MAKNDYTKFFLRIKSKSGNAFLYTRRQNDGANLLLKSFVEVDIKKWPDAVSTTSKWNNFLELENNYVISLTKSCCYDLKATKSKLEKAIVAVAQKE